jgi:fucose 4-O-acetylase-like acetyltransferase
LRVPAWGAVAVGVGLLLVKLNVDLRSVGFEAGRYDISLAHWGPLYQLMNFFIYMALGAALAPVLLKRLNKQKTLLLLCGLIVATAIIVAAIAFGDAKLIRRDAAVRIASLQLPVGIGFALISVAGALCAAELMERAKGFAFIRNMGRYSLYIFVMHVIFAAGVRTILLKAGVNSFAVHMIVGLAVGIGVPIGVAMLVKRLRMTWLFTLRPA